MKAVFLLAILAATGYSVRADDKLPAIGLSQDFSSLVKPHLDSSQVPADMVHLVSKEGGGRYLKNGATSQNTPTMSRSLQSCQSEQTLLETCLLPGCDTCLNDAFNAATADPNPLCVDVEADICQAVASTCSFCLSSFCQDNAEAFYDCLLQDAGCTAGVDCGAPPPAPAPCPAELNAVNTCIGTGCDTCLNDAFSAALEPESPLCIDVEAAVCQAISSTCAFCLTSSCAEDVEIFYDCLLQDAGCTAGVNCPDPSTPPPLPPPTPNPTRPPTPFPTPNPTRPPTPNPTPNPVPSPTMPPVLSPTMPPVGPPPSGGVTDELPAFVQECVNAPMASNSIIAGEFNSSTALHPTSFMACQRNVSRGVWYDHPGNGGLLTVEACSTDFNVEVAVFTGNCTHNVMCTGLATHTDGCAFLAWPTVETETYSVLVHSLNTTAVGAFYVDFDSLSFVG